MWDLPEPGIEPMFPALAGGFLSTGPPGKYHLSFYNYYGIDKETEPERYEAVLNNNLLAILYHVMGVKTYEELSQVDLESAAMKYLLGAGMTENDILTLKNNLR